MKWHEITSTYAEPSDFIRDFIDEEVIKVLERLKIKEKEQIVRELHNELK